MLTQQGVYASGLRNEHKLLDAMININRPFNVKFVGDKTVTYKNIIEVQHVGRDLRSGNKSDIVLHGITDSYYISIKQDNAMTWESTDKIMKERFVECVNLAVSQHLIEIQDFENVHKISSCLCIPMSVDTKRKVVFGNDLEEHGSVIFRTFTKDDFQYDESTNTLTVQVSHIYNNVNEIIGTEHDPYIMIRNDKTRIYSPITGLRSLAVTKSRVSGNFVMLDSISI